MKIIFIAPPRGEGGQKINFIPMAPPTLEYLAGLTRRHCPDADIKLIDANIEAFDPTKLEADLVGFSLLTPEAPWVYETADIIRQNGIPVVMGGPHVTALPQEAQLHADSIVLGEAESVWPEVLGNAAMGRLLDCYIGRQQPLFNLPTPETNLLKNKYMFGSFFTARGCPHNCNFCVTPRFFGNQIRFRPVPEVVSEIASSPRKMFLNIDDNMWARIPRAIELFQALKSEAKGKQWFGFGNLVSLEHPAAERMLNLARQAGLMQVRVGWESNNPLSLVEFNAKTKQGAQRLEAIKKIQAAGIDVMLYFVLGSRQDTIKEFEEAKRISETLKVAVFPQLLIPLPGTPSFDSYQKYFFAEQDWANFNGYRALFEHPIMTAAEREAGLASLWKELYTLPKIIKRLSGISLKGFPAAHFASLMSQISEPRGFTKLIPHNE